MLTLLPEKKIKSKNKKRVLGTCTLGYSKVDWNLQVEFKISLVGMHLLSLLILLPKIEYPEMWTSESPGNRHGQIGCKQELVEMHHLALRLLHFLFLWQHWILKLVPLYRNAVFVLVKEQQMLSISTSWHLVQVHSSSFLLLRTDRSSTASPGPDAFLTPGSHTALPLLKILHKILLWFRRRSVLLNTCKPLKPKHAVLWQIYLSEPKDP